MLGVHISRALEDQHLQEDVITDGVDEDEKKMRVTAKEIVNEAGTAEYAKAQPVVHTVLGELPTALALESSSVVDGVCVCRTQLRFQQELPKANWWQLVLKDGANLRAQGHRQRV